MSYGGRYSEPDSPVYRGVVLFEDHNGEPMNYCRGPYEKPAPAKAAINKWKRENEARQIPYDRDKSWEWNRERPKAPFKIIDAYVEVAVAWERHASA